MWFFENLKIDKNDLLDLELIPDCESKKLTITKRFVDSLLRCEYLKCAIAYCVKIPFDINEDYLSLLALKLSSSGSLCVDISLPTNLEWINNIKNKCKNSNIFIYAKKPVAEQIPEEKTSYVPDHLMHSKICFFEMEDYVEVWIGSHNWTRRAFDGPNLETSIILKIKKQSKIKNIFIDYIENINKLSYRYEEELLDFYKLLQGSLDYFNVIQVEDIKNNFNPYDESIISELVLVIDETGNPIKQNSQDLIYLKIKNNNQIKNYECLIENLGKINQNIIFNTDICIVKNSSNSISNMSDEYITHQKREWLIKNDCHFMLIKVQKKYPYAFSSSKNPDFWVFSDDDVIIKKMDPNHKNLYNIRTKVIKKIEKEIEKEKTRKKSFNSDEDQILLFQENFDKKNSKPFQNRGPKKLLVKIPQKVEYSNDDDIDYQLNGLVEKMSIKRNWGDLYDRFVFLSQERLMRDPDPSLNDGRG